MKKKILFSSLFLLFICSLSYAQPSWQWARSAGSADVTASVGAGQEENVYDMTTDMKGNLYAAGVVAQTRLNVDGHPKISYSAHGENWCIATFKCDGGYRWSKIISGVHGGGTPVAIGTDTSDGVYVLGGMPGFFNFHLDTDTVISGSGHNQQIMLIKYDTAGHFQWLRFPEPDTLTAGPGRINCICGMDVDESGNVSLLCILSNGGYAGGAYIVSSVHATSVHVLKYNSSGTFLSGMQLDITLTGNAPYLKMKRSHRNGRYYLYGQTASGGPTFGTMTFGSTLIDRDMFVGCFNSAGTLLWQKQCGNTYPYLDATFFGMDLDSTGNIYATGNMWTNDTFNTFIAINPMSTGPLNFPMIMKMDKDGNYLWAKNAYCDDAQTSAQAIKVNGNEVAITGYEAATFTWPGYADTLHTALGTYLYNVFLTRFDVSTGAVVGMDTVASPIAANEYPSTITSDKFHNLYIGGMFETQMFYSCGDILSTMGGETDIFIAKYGAATCDISSLGTHSGLSALTLSIYPNPVTNELVIENAAIGTIIKVFNIIGQQIYNSITSGNKQMIKTRDFATGTYLLQVTDTNGNRLIKTIVKR